MGAIEIVIICIAVAIVGGVIGLALWRKAKGKSSFCDCSGNCASCKSCPSKSPRKTK
ncbi:MAG: hypothetical protein IKM44_04165 [Clostridia bacterium]|nr:hypothetical protein [Clostridia bacterium]